MLDEQKRGEGLDDESILNAATVGKEASAMNQNCDGIPDNSLDPNESKGRIDYLFVTLDQTIKVTCTALIIGILFSVLSFLFT